MPVTRRTEAFRRAAEAVERELESQGADVHHDVVDLVLNQRIENVAEGMGLTARTAAGYLSFIDAAAVADDIARVISPTAARPPSAGGAAPAPSTAYSAATERDAVVLDLEARRRSRPS